jgi:hypothetical protein
VRVKKPANIFERGGAGNLVAAVGGHLAGNQGNWLRSVRNPNPPVPFIVRTLRGNPGKRSLRKAPEPALLPKCPEPPEFLPPYAKDE